MILELVCSSVHTEDMWLTVLMLLSSRSSDLFLYALMQWPTCGKQPSIAIIHNSLELSGVRIGQS